MEVINPHRFPVSAPPAVDFDGFGNASRYFDGVSDYIDLGDSNDFSFGDGAGNDSSFSIAAWVKLDVTTGNRGIFSKFSLGNGEWLLYYHASSNEFRWAVYDISNDWIRARSSVTINASQWYHVVGTYDGSKSVSGIKMYVNGSLDTFTETGGVYSGMSNTTTNCFIGQWAGANFIDGKVTDVRLYNSELSSTNIAAIYGGENITTNLVGHWLKDTDNVLDAAGTNHGTNYGSKYSYDNPSPPVEFGSASRSFNGSSDYIDLGNSTEFSFSDGVQDEPFSLCAWIKCNDNGTFRVLSKDNGTGSSREWLLSTDSGGNLNVYLISGGIFRGRAYTTPLPENEWLHVSATYDGSGGANFRLGLKLYVNGVKVDNADFGSGGYVAMTPSTNNDVFIGRYATTYADGKIADARIYDAELTASQVSDLYAGTDVQANLIGHWLTDNDDVEDKAGTNDGTNFGSTYSYDNPPMDLIPFGQRSRLFTSDYINTNTGFQSVFQSSFSISTWVRFDDGIPANSNIIFGNQSAAPISRSLIFLDNAGALTFGYFSNGNQARAEIDQNFANGDTGWFHYTAVVEPTGITIYKDGLVQTLDATDDGDMSAVTMGDYSTDIDCYIGARNLNGTPDLNMKGNIADFRIYDSALSASDVAKIYNRTDDKSNIYAWYLTNSDDVLDHAGTNDGTNNGSTYSQDAPL